ncbi:MAG TPA: hypothetical protein VGM53_35455 [Streptosporangiaceae bacterium]|jgi:hypothetical protein
MARRRIVFTDPDASPPVYPWGGAPGHLATRAQLAGRGLRPGRQGVQVLLLWPSRRGGRPRIDGYRYAELYDTGRARPRIAMSERRAAAAAPTAATSPPPGSACATPAPTPSASPPERNPTR